MESDSQRQPVSALDAELQRIAAPVPAGERREKGDTAKEARRFGNGFGVNDALEAGLPAYRIDASDPQWDRTWSLFPRYFQLGQQAYESALAS